MAALGPCEDRIADHQQTVAAHQFADLLGDDAVGIDRSSDDNERFLQPTRLQTTSGDRIRQKTDAWQGRHHHGELRWSRTARTAGSRQSDESNPEATHWLY